MSDLLEVLVENNGKIDKVNKKLDLFKNLFSMDIKNTDLMRDNYLSLNNIEIRSIYQDDTLNIVVGLYKFDKTTFHEHVHENSVEYLIVTKGEFLVKFGNNTSRELKRGDLAVIKQNEKHTVIALEDNSEMFAICIPPEKAYRKN